MEKGEKTKREPEMKSAQKKPLKLKKFLLWGILGLVCVATITAGIWYISWLNRFSAQKSRLSAIQSGEEVLNVILISIDTTRSDYIGCYGFEDIETPYIDQLATDGALFLKCDAHVPLTLPSHTNMLTGCYPPLTKVHDNNQLVADFNLCLQEILKEHGYATSAFIGSIILDGIYGLSQGFDYYGDQIVTGTTTIAGFPDDRRAREVVTEASKWIKENKGSPFFAFVHFYDPHAPYTPPQPYSQRYYYNPYAGEIAYVDATLGIFFEFLKQEGLWDNTLIILTGDHGEAFGEHNEYAHSVFIYEQTLHVPLIIHCPGLIPANQTVTEQVRLVDLMPTILDVLGIDIPEGISGSSLLPYIFGEKSDEPHYSYCESYHTSYIFGYSKLIGIQDNNWKYIKAPISELYNLKEDSEELYNLYFEDSEENEFYDQLLLAALTEMIGGGEETDKEVIIAEIDEATKAALYSLGYVSAPTTFSEEEMKSRSMTDPKEKIDVIVKYQQLLLTRSNDMLEMSNKLLNELLAEEPDLPFLNMSMAQNIFELGDYEEAFKWFQRAYELDSKNTMSKNYMGLCLVKQERWDEAEGHFVEIANNVESTAMSKVDAYLNLGTLYNNIKNQPEKAIYYMDRVLEVDPNNLRAHNYLTLLYFSRQRDLEKAEHHATQYLNNLAAPHDQAYEEVSKIYDKLKMLDE